MTDGSIAAAADRDRPEFEPEPRAATPPEPDNQAKSGRIGALQSRNFRLLWTGLIIAKENWSCGVGTGDTEHKRILPVRRKA